MRGSHLTEHHRHKLNRQGIKGRALEVDGLGCRILPVACFDSAKKLVGVDFDAGARFAGLVIRWTGEDGEAEIGQVLFDVGIHIRAERGDQHHSRRRQCLSAAVTDDTALVTGICTASATTLCAWPTAKSPGWPGSRPTP